jgi:hypothetical protein
LPGVTANWQLAGDFPSFVSVDQTDTFCEIHPSGPRGGIVQVRFLGEGPTTRV